MNSETGRLYPSVDAAKAAGVPEEKIVRIEGQEAAVRSISAAVKKAHREKMARESRRKNRK